MNIKIDKYIDKKNGRKLEVISLDKDKLWIINYISKSSYIFCNTYIFDNEEKKDNKLKDLKEKSKFEFFECIEDELKDFEISDRSKESHTIFQVFKKGEDFISCKTVSHTSEKALARNAIIGVKDDILYGKSYDNANVLSSVFISDLNFPFIRTLYSSRLFIEFDLNIYLGYTSSDETFTNKIYPNTFMYEEKKKLADEFFKSVPKKYPKDKKLSTVSMHYGIDEINIYDYEDKRRFICIHFSSLDNSMNIHYEKDRNALYRYSFTRNIGIDAYMDIVEEMVSSAGLFLDDLDKQKVKEFASHYISFDRLNHNKAELTDFFIKEGISKLPKRVMTSVIPYKG